MIQDPENKYLAALMSQWDVTGQDVLEIGCGKGRITRDLARVAELVVASDPDAAALEVARSFVGAANVEFLHAPEGVPRLADAMFDCAVYSLSLHHVPMEKMAESLQKAASLVVDDGAIVVIEPGDGGSFMYAKERFGAGSGDESAECRAAIEAMHSLQGWSVGDTVSFEVSWLFRDRDDYLSNLIPDWYMLSQRLLQELDNFLTANAAQNGIVLHAGRRLNVMRRVPHPRQSLDLSS